MSAVTIVTTQAGYWLGTETSLELRGYARMDFTTSDGKHISKGSPYELGSPYAFTATCPLSAGVWTIPQLVIDSTGDSPDHPVTAAYDVFMFASGRLVSPLFEFVRISASATPVAWSELIPPFHFLLGVDLDFFNQPGTDSETGQR